MFFLSVRRLITAAPTTQRCLASTWNHVQMGPPDPILGVTEAFKSETNPNKVLLGVGAYRDDNGKPFVLDCVRQAEKNIASLDKEYSPISGTKAFCDASVKLAFGANTALLSEKRVAASQTISGTGALRLASEFFSRFHRFPDAPTIYVPNPTWGNHKAIFKDGGTPASEYNYYNPSTCSLDFDGMMADFKNMKEGSVVLLHACAHNPTGVDINKEQWKEVCDLFKTKKLFPFFDMAYQGFATGSIDGDAFAPRLFVDEGHEIALCQSYAKNMGLYGERAGCLSFVTHAEKEADAVLSQLKIIARPMYSNPPIHGAQIVTEVLTNPNLTTQWEDEVKVMADRIISMRRLLRDGLTKVGSTKDWSHITDQIGMFCFSGMTKDQVAKIRSEHAIYLTGDGRISMAGVTSKNVEYLANAMHQVTK